MTLPFNPATTGYRILFHEGQANPCPGCSRSQWYVGRSSAECAFCGVALPMAEPTREIRLEVERG